MSETDHPTVSSAERCRFEDLFEAVERAPRHCKHIRGLVHVLLGSRVFLRDEDSDKLQRVSGRRDAHTVRELREGHENQGIHDAGIGTAPDEMTSSLERWPQGRQQSCDRFVGRHEPSSWPLLHAGAEKVRIQLIAGLRAVDSVDRGDVDDLGDPMLLDETSEVVGGFDVGRRKQHSHLARRRCAIGRLAIHEHQGAERVPQPPPRCRVVEYREQCAADPSMTSNQQSAGAMTAHAEECRRE